MKKILVLFYFFIGIGIITNAELLNEVVNSKDAKLRVASFNIAGGAKDFALNLEKTAKAILALDADFIAIQEVDNKTKRSGYINQAEELSKLTGYNYIFSKAIDFDGGEYGLAVLSKHPIKLLEKQILPSESYEQRIAMHVESEVPGFKEPILFISTHLDWHEDPKVRLEQIRAINGKAIDLRGIKILLGDLNDTKESLVIQELKRYWDSPLLTEKIDNRTWPANNPEIGVDYIFMSKAQKWDINEILIPNKPNGNYRRNWNDISDHIPVLFDLSLLEQ